MRDLERQIAEWRQTMGRASGQRADLLNELEVHLREEIDRLRGSGVPTDKVFDMAVSKLGAPARVGAEFDKLTATTQTWLPVKIARIGILAIVLFSVAVFFLKLDKGALLVTHIVCATLGYSMSFVIGALAVCALLAEWFGTSGPTQRHALIRCLFQFAGISAIFTGLGVVLGAFWAQDHMGRYWAWDLKETGGFLVFSWTALIAAAGRLKAVQTAVVPIAILGNAITAWAWFGANTGGKPGPLLAVFMAAHLVLFVAGAVRAMVEPRRSSATNS